MLRITKYTCIFVFALALPAAGQAQDAAPVTHIHYEAASAAAARPSPTGALAPRLQNLGNHKIHWFTCKAAVRPWLNQGVNLAYGFNHAEAARAFREAARLDANCAMAYWGEALVLGPNINVPMNTEDEPKAAELVKKAAALKSSPRERDYIAALARRYTGKAGDRKAADSAFVAAMRELSKKYPGDLDAATMFAESIMDTIPWGYWSRDGKPNPGTEEALAALHRVIKAHPNHPGALHYWVHMWEPTDTPERAEKEADRLLPLMPGAGHMVHMPAHIFFRVGRYEDVVTSNLKAVEADEDYITQCKAQGIYPLGYYPHNIHFVWMGSTALGQSQLAIESGRKVASKIPLEVAKDPSMAFLHNFLMVPTYALVRFGKWDEILSAPKPAVESTFTVGMWHYARGLALIGTGRLDDAEKELALLMTRVKEAAAKESAASFSANTDYRILRIAPEIVAGELAAKRHDFDAAIAHLQRAVNYDDALIYAEPADWHFPARHNLGAVLLQAGRANEAEVVYWEDLRNNAENGWALFGLAQALRAQKNDAEAARIEQRFQKAWAKADVKLTASRF